MANTKGSALPHPSSILSTDLILAVIDPGGTPSTQSITVSNLVTSLIGTTGSTFAVGNDTRITGAAQKSANLSDLASATTARTNLGLGTAATVNIGTLAQTASNLSDLASASAARTNLGLGTAATQATGTFLQAANNLSDLVNAATARTNLGVGMAINQRLIGNTTSIASKHWKSLMTTGKTTYTSTYNVISVASCAEYQWVRVVLKNCESVSVAIAGCIVAPTTSKTNRCVPTGGSLSNTLTNDSNTGWSQVTFAGANTVTLPAGSATAPSIVLSDWIQVRSQPSADGATSPYVLARIKMVETGTFSGIFLGTGNTDNTLDTYARADSAVGDFVTTPGGMTTNTSEVSCGPIAGFEFKASRPIINVMAVGSSTTMGGGNPIPQDAAYRSWVPMTQELLVAAGLPVSISNYGLSAATTAQYAAIGKLAIAAQKPNIVLYPPFGTNDGTPTQAIVDTMYARAIDFAQYALENGALPVFTFLCPADSYLLATDNLRKSLITRCQASGFVVCNMVPAVGDGASPERFQASYYFDGTHTNAAGYLLQAGICATTLTTIIKANYNF